MTATTNLDLDGLRELLRRATPGEWTLKHEPPREYDDYTDHGGFQVNSDGVEQLAFVWAPSRRIPVDGEQSDGPSFGAAEAEANAKLFIAAKKQLPTLLDRLSTAEAERDDLLAGWKDAIKRAATAEARAAELAGSLHRVTDHLDTWARDHSLEATTETWAALHCARATLSQQPDPARGEREGV